MNVSSPAYAGIQSASESLNLLAQRIAEKSTERLTQSVSDTIPKATQTITTSNQEQQPNAVNLAPDLAVAPPNVAANGAGSSGGRTEQVATYDASGRVNDRSQSSIVDLMTERLKTEMSLRANVEVAKATNNNVGKIIDETV